MEEEGIGRPSTYASIISTIQDRGYAQKRGNELIPSFTAFLRHRGYSELQFSDLVDTHFTAQMEDELDEVAAGKTAWDQLVSGFYLGDDDGKGINQRVEEGEVTYPAIYLGKDPETQEEVVVKVGKYGPYVRRGEGGSDNAATISEEMAPDELTLEVALDLLRSKSGENPPLTTDPVTGRTVTLQRGRYGEYLELGTDGRRKREQGEAAPGFRAAGAQRG